MSPTALATAPKAPDVNFEVIEKVLITGDLAQLKPEQRVAYYKQVCESLGLNPMTSPFAYITLNGKMVLYAKRDATDQLRRKHVISVQIAAREKIEDLYVVTARATNAAGRTDESIGAVNLKGLFGDALANALMKCETKAKRRVTLSICGLGMLDELEAEGLSDESAPSNAPVPVGAPELVSETEELIENYIVPFGGRQGQTLSQVGILVLYPYVKRVEDALAKGTLPKGINLETAKDFIFAAKIYMEKVRSGEIVEEA